MKWTKIESNSNNISKVKNHTAVFCRRSLYIYAGFDGSKHKNSLNILDLSSRSLCQVETPEKVPHGRNGHTATLYDSSIYVIGGWNSSVHSTTREIHVLHLDTITWEKILPQGEPMVSCNMHSANLYNHCIYVFRGGDGTNYLNDLHFYDIRNNTWNRVEERGKPPSPRANHASAVHAEDLYIFGGWNGVDRLNDLFRLHFPAMSWEKITAVGEIPRPRAGMSLNSTRTGLLMFGGSGVSSTSYNDLYVFDLENNTWRECPVSGEVPTPRAGHTLTGVSKRELILFGGSSGNQYSLDYYMLDIFPPPSPPSVARPLELNFRELCNNSLFSDIQFLVEGRLVYAHKAVVTRLSKHFSIMFTSGMRESRESSVEFSDIRLPVFMILLKYLYTGEVEIDAGTEGQEMSTEFIIEILHGADRFLLDPIVVMCEKMLIDRVSKENAANVLAQIENTKAGSLKEYCDWIIDSEN